MNPELLVAIALLCNAPYTTKEDIHQCQKDYVNCLLKKDKNYHELTGSDLASCVLERRN